MAIRFRESPDSRELSYGASGGGETLRATAITTAGESEGQVWLWALANSNPFYLGFIRNNLRVRPKGAPHIWSIEIEYGTTGVGGGDQPLGGVGNDGGGSIPNPTAPEKADPLKAGWSFSIRPTKLHYTLSRATVYAVKRDGGVAPDFQGRVLVSTNKDKSGGVDWPPEPAITIKRTVARTSVTLGYLDILTEAANRPSQNSFWGFDPYCIMLYAADGEYTEGEKWSITYEFGVIPREDNIQIVPGVLPKPPEVINKRGFDFLWVLESVLKDDASNTFLVRPEAAYVEELARPFNYALLGIG